MLGDSFIYRELEKPNTARRLRMRQCNTLRAGKVERFMRDWLGRCTDADGRSGFSGQPVLEQPMRHWFMNLSTAMLGGAVLVVYMNWTAGALFVAAVLICDGIFALTA
jgi:hypothetical protein